jgi:ubiquinol-cytochrome c reductase cytochrome c subunit
MIGPRTRPGPVRRRGTALLVLAAAAVPAVAIAQPPSGVVQTEREPGQSLAEWGGELFAANCASCHGPEGEGASPDDPIHGVGGVVGYGPDLRGVGARAPDFYLRTGRMPLGKPTEAPERGEPHFDTGQIRALTAYVAGLAPGPKIPDPDAEGASLSEGMHAFTEHCAGCHQIVGEGGYVTEARVPVLQHATATDIAEAVRIGPYVMPSFSRKDIPRGELNAIIAYVRASRSPADEGGLGVGHIGPVPEGMVAWAVAFIVLVGLCAFLGKRVSS